MSPAAWPPRRLRRLGRSRASGESPEPERAVGVPGCGEVGLLGRPALRARARGGDAGSGPAGGAVGGARAAALGEPSPGSSSRLRSKHGGGGVRGPSGETESGSYAERERGAGLRRRRHCRETTPTVSAPAAAAAPRAGPAAEVERGRSGTRRRGTGVAAFLRLRAAWLGGESAGAPFGKGGRDWGVPVPSRPGAGVTETVRLSVKGRGSERGFGPVEGRGPPRPGGARSAERGDWAAGGSHPLVGHLPGPSLSGRRSRGRGHGPATSPRRRRGGAGGPPSAPPGRRPAASSAAPGGAGVECRSPPGEDRRASAAPGLVAARRPPNLNASLKRLSPRACWGSNLENPARCVWSCLAGAGTWPFLSGLS